MNLENCTKYVNNFWDDSPVASNGYDAIVDHVNRTLELTSMVISLLENRLSIEDSYSKALRKCSKSIEKNNSAKKEGLISNLCLAMQRESEVRNSFLEDCTSQAIEQLKETFKKNYENIKKIKSDCSIFLKSRKSQYELCVKSCKSYTVKYRAHEVLVKKCGNDPDEKDKLKISKNLQTVKLAEKEARVSVEMLCQTLSDWEKNFINLCQTAEQVDRVLLETIKVTYEKYTKSFFNCLEENKKAISDHLRLSPEYTDDAYLDKFISEKGTNVAFTKYAYMSDTDEGDKREFFVVVTTNMEGRNSIPQQKTQKTSKEEKKNTATKQEEPHSTSVPSAPPLAPVPPPPEPPSENSDNNSFAPNKKVVALYDYKAQNDDELSFTVGAEITIISQEDESWYVGKLAKGTSGVFPISYVKPL